MIDQFELFPTQQATHLQREMRDAVTLLRQVLADARENMNEVERILDTMDERRKKI